MTLIAEKGPDRLSLREVARRVDYSPAGLYEYFGSKQEIIDAICEEADTRLSQALLSVPTDLPVDEYFVELGMAYVQYARDNAEYFVFLFTNRTDLSEQTPANPEQLQIAEDDTFNIVVRAMQQAIDSGLLRPEIDMNAIELSYELWALAHGMAMLQVRHLEGFPLEFPAIDRQAFQAFWRGLTVSK